MAGVRGKSGPPGNQNAFRHGLATVHQRRVNGALTQDEQDIRAVILTGLLTDKGGEAQISTAMCVPAEIIASDVSLLVTFNQAIDGVIQNDPKAKANPKALGHWTAIRGRWSVLCQEIFNRLGWTKFPKSNRFRRL
jgi:hypothetical protein